LCEFLFESDRANLPASERDVRNLLGHPDPTLEAALFRHSEVTGDAVHLGVIEAVSRKLVVGSKPLEDGGALEDEIGLISGSARRGGKNHKRERRQKGRRAPTACVICTLYHE
jgi:hypothetical protein